MKRIFPPLLAILLFSLVVALPAAATTNNRAANSISASSTAAVPDSQENKAPTLLPNEEPNLSEDSVKELNEQNCTRRVWLNWQTKKRLDALYHQIFMGYVNLIETYTYAGALTEAQKQLRMQMLKNYIQTFYNRHYQWCSEHEADEWEEEWFNRDGD